MSYAGQNALAGTVPHVGHMVVLNNGQGIVSAVIDGIVPGQIDDITLWVFSEQRARNNVAFANVAPDALTTDQWTWQVSA